MLTAVKNQLKVMYLSFKYSLMRELLNKFTFISNVVFMILNNACMIVQWIVLFSIKSEMGGYSFKQILLLWGLASGIYGFAHFFFDKAFDLSDTINSGKLDAFIVQPKNVLLSVITSNIHVSALGDMAFAIIMYFLYGFNMMNFLLFILFSITGGLIMVSFSIILNSLSFWFNNTDIVADLGNHLLVNFATYPDGIFKGITKWLLFTLIPVGITSYIPVKTLINFNPQMLLLNIFICVIFMITAYFMFNTGLKRYSSSNLANARF